jgi:hypothetical protein
MWKIWCFVSFVRTVQWDQIAGQLPELVSYPKRMFRDANIQVMKRYIFLYFILWQRATWPFTSMISILLSLGYMELHAQSSAWKVVDKMNHTHPSIHFSIYSWVISDLEFFFFSDLEEFSRVQVLMSLVIVWAVLTLIECCRQTSTGYITNEYHKYLIISIHFPPEVSKTLPKGSYLGQNWRRAPRHTPRYACCAAHY